MTWRQVHSVRTPGPLQTRNHSRLGVRTLCIPNAQETGRATTLHVQDVSHLKSVVPSAVSVVSNARPLLFASLLALTSLLFPTTVRADCSTAPLASTDDLVVSFLAGQGGTQAAPSTQYASTVKEGMLVYDDTTNALRYCDGTNWVSLVGSGGGGSATAAGTGSEVQFRNSGTGAFAADANFVWDDTNDRLGIGTATPGTALHILGNAASARMSLSAPVTANALIDMQSKGTDGLVNTAGNKGWRLNVRGDQHSNTPMQNAFSFDYYDGTTGYNYFSIMPNGAVGMGAVPATSALMDLTSTTRGFLPPRMTEAQRDAIASPATGLVVYNTDTNALNYYDGSAWTAVGSGGGASGPFSISATYSGALPANQTLTNTCDFAGTANITVPASGLYFVRGLAYGYKYSGNLVDLVVSLKDGSNTTVFSAASGLASTTGFYVYADSSAFVYLTAGTYTVRARGTNGSDCGTTTFNQLFSARVDIYDVRGGGGGGGGSTTLAGLTDVDTSAAANGKALIYNSTSSKWEAQTIGATAEVAFTALKSSIPTQSGAATKVTGFTELTDVGNNFNGTTFTAPSAGVYVFHASYVKNAYDAGAANEDYYMYFYKNGVSLGAGYSVGAGEGPMRDGTARTIAVSLAANDTIEIFFGSDSDTARAAYDLTFTGFKLGGGTGGGSGSGTPASPASSVQFNNAGAFGGDAALTWDNTNKRLGIGTAAPVAPLHLSNGTTPEASLITTTDKILSSFENTSAGFTAIVASNATNRPVFKGTRSRGTLAAPTAVANNDEIFSLVSAAYDGVDVQSTAGVFFRADGNASPGVAPQRISFVTSETNASARTEKLTIKANGDVGIGTTTPDASALLDVFSTSKGFLPPRMTTAQRDAIASPAEGLVVYNTTTKSLDLRVASGWLSFGGSMNGNSMVSGWPDAILCSNDAGTNTWILYRAHTSSTPDHVYVMPWNSGTWEVRFNNSKAFVSRSGITGTSCDNESIADLYAQGRAFNFVGGATASADGTSGQVQFNEGGNLKADAALHWDNTNKRLGVGIVTPSQKLHVVGGQVRIHPGTGNYATTFTGSVASALSITGAIANNEYVRMTFGNGAEGNYAGIGAQVTPSGSYLHLGTSNNYANGITNSALVINPAGAVGIGTTSPGSTLDVKGTIRLSGATSGYVALTAAAAAGSTTYTLPSTDGSNGQVLSTNGSGVLSWTTPAASSGNYFWAAASHLTYSVANGSCPTGSRAIQVHQSSFGQTGTQICAADTASDGARTICDSVRYWYITVQGTSGAYTPNNRDCSASVPHAWPWARQLTAPNSRPDEWHSQVYVVCCRQ